MSPFSDDAGASFQRTIRIRIFFGFCILLLLIFLYRLFSLQILNTLVYQNRAQNIIKRIESIKAQRGEIYDRNMDLPLAKNLLSFSVFLDPEKISYRRALKLIPSLSETLKLSPAFLRKRLSPKIFRTKQKVLLKKNLSLNAISGIAENIENFPGLFWRNTGKRFYTREHSLSHIVGYIGDITPEELPVFYNKGYNANSVIGKSGIEQYYDYLLKGKDGSRLSTVNARGEEINSEIKIKPPQNGKVLRLTIDRKIQLLAEKALGKRNGSAIVLKPATGEILALVSYPYYNPNQFTENGKKPAVNPESSGQSASSFLNRAVQAVYSPASTFKIVMSAALLETKAFPASEKIFAPGFIYLGNRKFKEHITKGFGWIKLIDALAQSSNIYFGIMGTKYLGIKRIAQYAENFGLGRKTGIDLNVDAAGLVPTPQWKKKTFGTAWTQGDTLNVSIGQGFLTVSPLQMANLMALIVNEGVIYRPHLLKEIINPDTGEVEKEIPREVFFKTKIAPPILRRLKRMLRYVVTNGTPKVVIKNTATKVAGKTGTGEVGIKKHWNSWFVSFAPAGAPPEDQVVVVTMVEYTNKWDWWAPKAADIIYEGLFKNIPYEQVIRSFKRRGVWYTGGIHPDESNDQTP